MVSFVKNLLTAGSLLAVLSGCDTKKQIKVEEIIINDCPVRLEVVKEIKKLDDDTYRINIYDSNGSLRGFYVYRIILFRFVCP